MKTQTGFTLIEILIAVTILAIISTLTSVNISRSVKFKNKIEKDLDDYAAVRDSLVIIGHDVNLAFHWVDLNEKMQRSVSSATPAPGGVTPQGQSTTIPTTAAPGAQPTPPRFTTDGKPLLPTEKLTAFVGNEDSLYLTTLSHVRTTVDSQESDQARVGYYLKDVKSVHDGQKTKALVRSEGTVLDGSDITKGGKETVLLENVKAVKFRYMGNDDKDWLETWKSVDTLDEAQRNKFPDAVEVTITTKHNDKEITLSTMAAVHMPNNDQTSSVTPTPTPTPGVVTPGQPATQSPTTPTTTTPTNPTTPSVPGHP